MRPEASNIGSNIGGVWCRRALGRWLPLLQAQYVGPRLEGVARRLVAK
jgi:hypothetical protein